MKVLQFILCLTLVALLIWINQVGIPADSPAYGGLTWVGWMSILLVGFGMGFVVLFTYGSLGRKDRSSVSTTKIRTLTSAELAELGVDKFRGPSYPHPVIFPERCIGCQACVDACPHDVLAIVDGTAAAVAPDLCMEDTACQAECPVNPKACIVINTAKEVRSLPTPTRDGSTFQTNVTGCFIIGDVSGVPLIKNAVKEGADVIVYIANELREAPPEPKAEYDVAIIGIGPGGASAAASAREMGLRYVGIEQDKILSTIDLYPKGKYIFFKPDTKDWMGGIPTVGLGLAKAKYAAADQTLDDAPILGRLGPELSPLLDRFTAKIHDELIAKIPASLRTEISPQLKEKIGAELKRRIAGYLRTTSKGDPDSSFRTQFLPAADQHMETFARDVSDQLQRKIPGDQRENILNIWLGSLREKGVAINEHESCKTIDRADDGDYFIVKTEQGDGKTPMAYRARRVVIAIGLRGAPNKLRLPNEDLKVVIDGRQTEKVKYGLSEPMQFRGKRIVVVGGGNVAVEAAVDLVAVRDGAAISARKPEDQNQVTMLVRDYLAPTVKFGNKFQLYKCAEDGLIDLRFGAGIKEMRENELVIENVVTKEELGVIPNDYVFALIGGERPNRFLESIGITIK